MRIREIQALSTAADRKRQVLDFMSARARGLSVKRAAAFSGTSLATAYRWDKKPCRSAKADRANPITPDKCTRRQNEIWPHVSRSIQAHPDYGAKGHRDELLKEGIHASKHTIRACMKAHGHDGARYTKGRPVPMPYADNLLNRDWDTEDVNDVWVADTTQIKTGDGWLYLAAVLDLHSRRIVGFAFSDDTAKSTLTNEALRMALRDRKPPAGIWYHTDCGNTYVSDSHIRLVEKHGMVRSNSGIGKCHDNAVMESCFSLIKRILRKWLELRKEAEQPHKLNKMARCEVRSLVRAVIRYYNDDRAHGSLGGYTPVAFESLALGVRQEIHARMNAQRERRRARKMARIEARKRASAPTSVPTSAPTSVPIAIAA
jgi:putative transposase